MILSIQHVWKSAQAKGEKLVSQQEDTMAEKRKTRNLQPIYYKSRLPGYSNAETEKS